MTLRRLFSTLLSRCEGAFERAIDRGAPEAPGQDGARGEFISTLIIDHGAASRTTDGRAMRRRLFD